MSPLPLLVNHLGIFSYKGPLPSSLLLFYWVVCFYKLLPRNSLNMLVMTPFFDIYLFIYIYRESFFFFHYVACLCTVLMILWSNRSSNLNVIDIFPAWLILFVFCWRNPCLSKIHKDITLRFFLLNFLFYL